AFITMKLLKTALRLLLFSPIVTNGLLLLLALLYAIATFTEHQQSTEVARRWFYNNPAIYILLFLGCINLCGILFSRKYFNWKKAGMLIFHFSFFFILAGAWITYNHGYEGRMHIREGESASRIFDNQNNYRSVPFNIYLKDFMIHRYPGSQSPSSFESSIRITGTDGQEKNALLSMNKVIYQDGYRIYQSSYDPDEKGSVLLVNYDPYGALISYIGYGLMFLGILWLLLSRESRFGQLNAKLKQRTCTLLFIGLSTTLSAQNYSSHTPSASHAAKFGELSIQCPSGRIEPVNTYASKLVRKICRTTSFNQLTAEQVVLGIMLYPDFWNKIPLITIENTEVHQLLSTKNDKLSYADFFNTAGEYKLQQHIEAIYNRQPKERTRFDKDLLKLDEKINILFALQHGELLSLFPLKGDEKNKWFSPGDNLTKFSGQDSLFVSRIFPIYINEVDRSIKNGNWQPVEEVLDMIKTYQKAQSPELVMDPRKTKAEIIYNRLNIFGRSAIFYLAFSTILLLLSILYTLTPTTFIRNLIRACVCSIITIFIFQSAGIALRWYISGQAPWSNAYESMVYVAWCGVFAGLFFLRRSALTFGLSGLLAGFILLVSNFNFMDPEITPLVPVLKSPWLMFHVAIIMASYGFFGMSFLLSLFSMISDIVLPENKKKYLFKPKIQEFRIMNEMSLIVGLCLLSAGTFLGAIWANESWGRYWGWDPKETWALITMLVYAFVVHSHMIKSLRNNWAFNAMVLIAFASVLMTYFGVNYYLSGLHSYGKSDTPGILNIIYAGYTIVLGIIILGYRRRQTRNIEKKHYTEQVSI
ncbi:MAG: cytochrome c biogenesis protein CcsA, partial [Bacteroidales bacterium]